MRAIERASGCTHTFIHTVSDEVRMILLLTRMLWQIRCVIIPRRAVNDNTIPEEMNCCLYDRIIDEPRGLQHLSST